jgi:hypothetical protein
VPKKKTRKRVWLKTGLVFILTPVAIWALAFLIWLYWYDIAETFGRRENGPAAKAGKKVEQSTKPSDKSAQERIGEEDRKKLEEILKSKN